MNNSSQPHQSKIFKAFEINKKDLKVIIVGQDPYPVPDVATGLAFAIEETNDDIPPSLQIIIDELALSYYNDITFDIDRIDRTMQHWVDQGVMMLNSSLSVDSFKPEGLDDLTRNGTHSNYWRVTLMESLFEELNKSDEQYIFAFFGQKAQYYAKFIDETRHIIYKTYHPVADYRLGKEMFRGSKVFNNINNSLSYLKKDIIEWAKN